MPEPESAGAHSDERPIINIEGDLVALGPIRRDLIPTYARWINDFGTVRTLFNPPGPMTIERETAWFEATASGEGDTSFTIYERATLPSSEPAPTTERGQTWRPIGNTGLSSVDLRHRTAEFGILIGEADARGKGYGTEAARLVLDYAFTALGLHNVMLRVYAFNLAGLRAYEKAGFREFGRQREARRLNGKRWDIVYMDCLPNEFVSPVLSRVFVPDEPRP